MGCHSIHKNCGGGLESTGWGGWGLKRLRTTAVSQCPGEEQMGRNQNRAAWVHLSPPRCCQSSCRVGGCRQGGPSTAGIGIHPGVRQGGRRRRKRKVRYGSVSGRLVVLGRVPSSPIVVVCSPAGLWCPFCSDPHLPATT